MTERILTVTVQSHPGGATVLTAAGELDHHTAPRLSRVLDGTPFEPDRPIMIDLAGLTYCDSTGITVLITAYHRAQTAGTTVTLAAMRPELFHTFRTIGLDQIFTFQPTTTQALGARLS
ncbi:STAS domain-containing protein [Streptomyces sp. cmx-4-7]|uniref:STAS domain-containing protein n=1 Tax=Streptomyces sp. cmx-4-7 TaxID=2790939 RepID=UPI0039806222